MSKKPPSSSPSLQTNDQALWQQVIKGVKPLNNKQKITPPLPPKPNIEPHHRGTFAEESSSFSNLFSTNHAPHFGDLNPTQPDLEVGIPMGLDRNSANKLKKGRYPIEGRLDLHGLTQDIAHNRLRLFIQKSYEQQKRCVIIITGKGMWRENGGILKQQVPLWLNQSPLRSMVLGINHARPEDGGTGALYVLLKRQRPEQGLNGTHPKPLKR